MHVKKKTSLEQVKDQYNFKIFYVKLEENISTNVNHAWETDGYTLILTKSLLISKNVPSSPSKNLKVYDITKDLKKKYL